MDSNSFMLKLAELEKRLSFIRILKILFLNNRSSRLFEEDANVRTSLRTRIKMYWDTTCI